MSVPESSRAGWLGAAAAGCVLLTGCGATVAGHPVAGEAATVQAHVAAGLEDLLPTQAQFPARYSVVVLPPEAAAQAAGDLTGIARGAAVHPAGCAPPEQRFGPDQTAIAVGTDGDARATVTVQLARTSQQLSALREQVARCGEIRVNQGGAITTVATQLDPAPPVAADDSIALRRTVIPDIGGVGLTQSMQTLVGQVGDVRITVTHMTFGASKPDTAALDEVFTTTVHQVQQG
ncbi:sensor domain-containing protein [Nocardia sp. NPDC051832]|uniref:sensor domain-containing protein n=1 Tax=Nocardia sp. NPDC051832 TaxID=3155673 RepID=UPI003424C079